MRKTNLFRHVTEAEPLLPFGKKRSSFPGSRKQSEAAIIDRCREITDEGGNIIDPGFGFSKTISKNYELMASLKYFHISDEPVSVAVSRKSMIYKLLGSTPKRA